MLAEEGRCLLVYLVPTMCKRKRPGLCLPGPHYLAEKTRPGHKAHGNAVCIEGVMCLLDMEQLRAV